MGAVVEIAILTNEFEVGPREILDKPVQLHSIVLKNLGAVIVIAILIKLLQKIKVLAVIIFVASVTFKGYK